MLGDSSASAVARAFLVADAFLAGVFFAVLFLAVAFFAVAFFLAGAFLAADFFLRVDGPAARRSARSSEAAVHVDRLHHVPLAQAGVGGAVRHVGTEAAFLHHDGQICRGVGTEFAQGRGGGPTSPLLGLREERAASSSVTVSNCSSLVRLRVSVPRLR